MTTMAKAMIASHGMPRKVRKPMATNALGMLLGTMMWPLTKRPSTPRMM